MNSSPTRGTNIELIGVPFDGCGKRAGSRLGPAAVRLADLSEVMDSIGVEVKDSGDVPIESECVEPAEGLKNFEGGIQCIRGVKARVAQALERNSTPLVIGGDHFLSAGSVGAALDHFGSRLAVVWIDAHADLNTPESSPSGNLHGMPYAALLSMDGGVDGLPAIQWHQILKVAAGANPLLSKRSAWFGLRELDPAEQSRIQNLEGSHVVTMHDIDKKGVVECLEGLDGWLRRSGAEALWVSFDVDVLDPLLAPGTGTAVRGGLSYREMHIFGELLYEILAEPSCPYRLAGLDLVEINPLTDTNNITALTAVEWIASLFGKRILGPKK